MMTKSIKITAIWIFLSLIFAASLTWADGKFLADKHKDNGVACADCHGEKAPPQSVKTQQCLECHENRAQLAEMTKAVDPNPHQNHEGKLDCGACHHAHKKSESECIECHDWGYKVP